MIRIFCYMKIFIYMVFTRHSAGKIWSWICMLDIVLHYQINPVRLIWLLYCIIFVCQVNLMIIYMFRTRRCIKLLYTNVQGKVNPYVKMKSKNCREGVASCNNMWLLWVWNVTKEKFYQRYFTAICLKLLTTSILPVGQLRSPRQLSCHNYCAVIPCQYK